MRGAAALWSVAVIVCLCATVYADLPIHCLQKEVLGTWTFELNRGHGDSREFCGYTSPDSHVHHFTVYSYELFVNKTLTVRLSDPNIATLEDGHATKGTWTMVFDEGFEVRIADKVFFAYFAYKPHSIHVLGRMRQRDYDSHCDRTMIGWYHSTDLKQWGCYQAKRHDAAPYERPTFTLPQLRAAGFQVYSRLQTAADMLPFKVNHTLVSKVNTDPNSPWRAKVPRVVEGKTNREVNAMRGLIDKKERKSSHGFAPPAMMETQGASFEVDMGLDVHGKLNPRLGSLMFKHRGALTTSPNSLVSPAGVGGVLRKRTRGTGRITYSAADEALERLYGLPSELDLRQHVYKIKDQGDYCPSCYALAVAVAAEAQLSYRTGRKVELSSQGMLSCSHTTQGCRGGYPFLLAKHGHEYGFVPEACFPYTTTGEAKCNQQCTDSEVFFTDDYKYIGGWYGASEEIAMMQALHENGPFVTGFSTPLEFLYYKSGVFVCDDRPEQDSEGPWEHTNHLLPVVGYGVDRTTGIKYWLLVNSWGEEWGDHGYIKVARGADHCAVESMPVSFKMGRTRPAQVEDGDVDL